MNKILLIGFIFIIIFPLISAMDSQFIPITNGDKEFIVMPTGDLQNVFMGEDIKEDGRIIIDVDRNRFLLFMGGGFVVFGIVFLVIVKKKKKSLLKFE